MTFAGFGRSAIPFDMFDLDVTAEEARRAAKLATLYHRGQELAWDGREVLQELLREHGGIQLAPEKRAAMAKIFGVIMWGELAAWKISAELADKLEPLEAKMAATSQAHDEARHFYVMHDYLTELGQVPRTIDRASRGVLDLVLETPSLVAKLLGMQLMVETMALTIFQAVREARVEPVLSDLLRYYEKDEARHVGLGVQALPGMISRLSRREGLALFLFQMRVVGWTIAGLKSLEPSLRELGIPPRTIMHLGRAKQIMAFDQLWSQITDTRGAAARDGVIRFVNGIGEVMFPREPAPRRALARLARFRDGWRADPAAGLPATSLDPSEPARDVRLTVT